MDTAALIAALRSGRLAAAGLDVYEHEPEVPAELVALENVVLAPHIGSATEPARNGMARLVAENVIALLEGGEPITPVELIPARCENPVGRAGLKKFRFAESPPSAP